MHNFFIVVIWFITSSILVTDKELVTLARLNFRGSSNYWWQTNEHTLVCVCAQEWIYISVYLFIYVCNYVETYLYL